MHSPMKRASLPVSVICCQGQRIWQRRGCDFNIENVPVAWSSATKGRRGSAGASLKPHQAEAGLERLEGRSDAAVGVQAVVSSSGEQLRKPPLPPPGTAAAAPAVHQCLLRALCPVQRPPPLHSPARATPGSRLNLHLSQQATLGNLHLYLCRHNSPAPPPPRPAGRHAATSACNPHHTQQCCCTLCIREQAAWSAGAVRQETRPSAPVWVTADPRMSSSTACTWGRHTGQDPLP